MAALDNTLANIGEGLGLSDSAMNTATNFGADAIFGYAANRMMGNPVGKTWNKIDPLSYFRKDKPSTFNSKTNNNGANHQNNKSFNGMENDVTHNKAPYTNFAGQPSEHHPSNRSKGIIAGLGERFNLAGKAMEGGGFWRTKLAMGAGALFGGSRFSKI